MVYVTSFELPLDIMAYYVKILEIGGIKDPGSRIHILYPENCHIFAKNELCLGAVTYYSPKLLKKLSRLAEGKNAYIVNGYPSVYDLKIAVRLGIPILTGNPMINLVYSSKYITKCLFEDLNLPTMPFSDVIKGNIPRDTNADEKNLVTVFAELILDYIDNWKYDKWVFKINDEFGGRGVASFATDNLSIINDIRNKQCDKKDIKTIEDLETVIKRMLPAHLLPATTSIFRSYAEYKEAFFSFGGIIEAHPKNNIQSIAAVCFIEPDGTSNVIATYEKIVYEKLTIGYITPQKKIPYKVLLQTSKRVASALYENNVFGYITIDFIVQQSTDRAMKVT